MTAEAGVGKWGWGGGGLGAMGVKNLVFSSNTL